MDAPEADFIDIFAACAKGVGTLKPEDRGRVLRALVELYRPDFDKRPYPTRAVLGQLTGGMQQTGGQLATGGLLDYQPIKYGGQ